MKIVLLQRILLFLAAALVAMPIFGPGVCALNDYAPVRQSAEVSPTKLMIPPLKLAAASAVEDKKDANEKVWKSEDLSMLAVGMAVGDVDGDGNNEIVIVDPGNVYVYKFTADKLNLVAEYSAGHLEIKSVDVVKAKPQGPARIYVSAQNRGALSSFVLELKKGSLTPVIQQVPFFVRAIYYPSKGWMLLGQRKGMRRTYESFIFNVTDKGDDLEESTRFGTPLKIPIFGFCVGDFEGKLKPLIAVYDKEEHLRLYDPSGKRLYVSRDFYGGSDIIIRHSGPEEKSYSPKLEMEVQREYFRPRVMALDLNKDSVYELLAITHSSKTRRFLSRTKMLEDGQIVCMSWNGDAFAEKWATPKIQGMIADFAVDTLPGSSHPRLITLERKKTDWLAFIRSRSQVRVYDIQSLMREGNQNVKPRED